MRKIDDSEYHDLVRRWRASGMSKAAFADWAGISRAVFYYWSSITDRQLGLLLQGVVLGSVSYRKRYTHF
jgi:hypothetical protein